MLFFIEQLQESIHFGIPCKVWVEVEQVHNMPTARLVGRNLGGTCRIRAIDGTGVNFFTLL